MKFNFSLDGVRINSEWFEYQKRKSNVYQKIGYKGLNLYFQLFKFRLHKQNDEHVFITSLGLLRKECGYPTQEVFELLKKLKSAKVIRMLNISRWDYLIDSDGKYKDNNLLVIAADDPVPLGEKEKNYIYIDFGLFELYREKGLNERYYPLYCLIKKWSGNKEGKSWMSVDKMARILDYDKDTVHRMIYKLNSEYLLCSVRKKSQNRNAYYFEHYILDSVKDYEKFKERFKDKCDKLIKNRLL